MHIHICVVHSLRLPPHVSYLLSFQHITYKHPLLFTRSSTCIVLFRFLYCWFVPLWTICKEQELFHNELPQQQPWFAATCPKKQSNPTAAWPSFSQHTPQVRTFGQIGRLYATGALRDALRQWVCYIFPQVVQAHSWWLRRHTVVGKYLLDP